MDQHLRHIKRRSTYVDAQVELRRVGDCARQVGAGADVASRLRLVRIEGCNSRTRKHERETELDSKCRDMFLQQHEASVKMYRYLFQVTATATF